MMDDPHNDFAKIVIPRIKMMWIRNKRMMKIKRIYGRI